VLLTCERGREVKCKREAIEILRHYYSPNKDVTKNEKVNSGSLSIEEELALLRKGTSAGKTLSSNGADPVDPFTSVDTGCNGIVFVANISSSLRDVVFEKGESDQETSKKRKVLVEEETQDEKVLVEEEIQSEKVLLKEETQAKKVPLALNEEVHIWDPLPTIKQITDDIRSGCDSAPGSRFVLRMIPVQMTCYPDNKEIENVVKHLIKKVLPPLKLDVDNESELKTSLNASAKTTFAIAFKKRNCSHILRDQVISTVGLLFNETQFKVDLSEPEYTVIIEVCKTLCFLSIIKDIKQYTNFNLMTLRENEAKKLTK